MIPGKTPKDIEARAVHLMQNYPQNAHLWRMILGALINLSNWFKSEGYALTKQEQNLISRKVNEIYKPASAAQRK